MMRPMRCTGDYDDARRAESYDKRRGTTRAEFRILPHLCRAQSLFPFFREQTLVLGRVGPPFIRRSRTNRTIAIGRTQAQTVMLDPED